MEIKHAIERIFKVKVEKVIHLKGRGKKRRKGRLRRDKTPDRKKAIVKLKAGERIEIFEGL